MIKYIFCDIDGTLTNGLFSYDIFGNDIKYFNVKDGIAIKELLKCNVEVILITGRKSTLNLRRARELRIKYIFQNVSDKKLMVKSIITKLKFRIDEGAYVGDDTNDLESMKLFNYRFCPNDASPTIKNISTFVSSQNGGFGSMVSIAQEILKINGVNL